MCFPFLMSVIQKQKHLRVLNLFFNKFTEEQTEILFYAITKFEIFNSLTTLYLMNSTNFSSD